MSCGKSINKTFSHVLYKEYWVISHPAPAVRITGMTTCIGTYVYKQLKNWMEWIKRRLIKRSVKQINA